MFLNTFPIAVGVHFFASVVGVFDICHSNVCTIGIKIKSKLVKRAKVEKSEVWVG